MLTVLDTLNSFIVSLNNRSITPTKISKIENVFDDKAYIDFVKQYVVLLTSTDYKLMLVNQQIKSLLATTNINNVSRLFNTYNMGWTHVSSGVRVFDLCGLRIVLTFESERPEILKVIDGSTIDDYNECSDDTASHIFNLLSDKHEFQTRAVYLYAFNELNATRNKLISYANANELVASGTKTIIQPQLITATFKDGTKISRLLIQDRSTRNISLIQTTEYNNDI